MISGAAHKTEVLISISFELGIVFPLGQSHFFNDTSGLIVIGVKMKFDPVSWMELPLSSLKMSVSFVLMLHCGSVLMP